MINAISTLIGGASGLYTLVTLLSMVLNASRNGISLGNSEFSVVTVLVALALTTVAVAVVTRLLCLAVLTVLTRGPVAIEWARPSECVSFDSWLSCSWNFASRNGRQEGLRLFGLGIAFQGDHGRNLGLAGNPATP